MSALRQRLKRPETYLVGIVVLAVLTVADSFREPADQLGGRIYVQAVHGYQKFARPVLTGRVQCRYKPSCSEYSIAAVQKHGIRRGLMMTAARIRSCKRSVPLGTYDPVR
jgi:putative membrane protein insertion efficiency factor